LGRADLGPTYLFSFLFVGQDQPIHLGSAITGPTQFLYSCNGQGVKKKKRKKKKKKKKAT
jgi:hypothetical protein